MYQAEDILLRDYLLSVAGVYNCRGGTNGDVPTNISLRDCSNINATLSTNNAFKFLNGKLGEDRYGSSPIRSGYVMLASTELQADLDGLDGFISNWNYPNQENTCYSEYGSILNLRIFTSSEAAVQRGASMNGNDVFNNMVVARESYAHIDQDGYSSQLIYRDPIYSGALAMNGTLAIKFAQSQIILQETWIRNMRCTLSV